ncbi:hypothetical protein ABGV42_02070 [Paenibacillus pabuli]|uniref:hypothetical protein n=1 Tax=Paenibacillus pabuli TaxID=1472 RepID=UPI003242840B
MAEQLKIYVGLVFQEDIIHIKLIQAKDIEQMMELAKHNESIMVFENVNFSSREQVVAICKQIAGGERVDVIASCSNLFKPVYKKFYILPGGF